MIAFDFDGTLVDCQSRQVAVAAFISGKRGLKLFHAGEFWRHKRNGFNTKDALARLGCDIEVATEIAVEWAETVENDCWLALDQRHEFSISLFSHLHNRRIRTGIVTARSRPEAVLAEIAKLEFPCETHIEVVSPVAASKEKAEQLRRLGASIFIGDTESDWAAASLAKIPFLGVSWGQRCASFLRGVRIPHIIERQSALEDAIEVIVHQFAAL